VNCDETRSHIYVYLDREGSFFRRWRSRRHLRRCPPCEGGATFESRLRIRIREACLEELPHDLESRLRSTIREQQDEA
jgi:mycothiol system anti-sigma-R factor